MIDVCTYSIKIRGRIDPTDLAFLCPPDIQILRADVSGLTFSFTSDQAALLGLMRVLHARGVVFEEIICTQLTPP